MAFCLAAATALLPACKDGISDLDMKLTGPGDLEGAQLVDTFSLEGYTVRPVRGNLSSDLERLVLAWRPQDPRTGQMSSIGYFEVRLPEVAAPAPRLAHDAKLTIRLPFQLLERASTQLTVRFDLFELAQGYNPNQVYFTSDEFALRDPAPVATATIARIDTLEGEERYVTFTIAGGLADRMLTDYLNQSGWNNNDLAFTARFPGFALRMEAFDEQGQPVAAAVGMGIGVNSSAGFRFRHTVKMPPKGIFQKDSVVTDSVAMQLNGNSRHHTFIAADRATSEVNALFPGPVADSLLTNAGRRVYLQGGRPLWAYVRIPGLDDFLSKEPNIVVLRAELALVNDNGPEPEPPTSILAYRGAPEPLQLTRNNLAPDGILNEDIQSQFINFDYDSAKGYYPVNITPMVQSISAGRETNRGLTLSVPISNYTHRSFTFNTDKANPKRSKLRIYFVRPNAGG